MRNMLNAPIKENRFCRHKNAIIFKFAMNLIFQMTFPESTTVELRMVFLIENLNTVPTD